MDLVYLYFTFSCCCVLFGYPWELVQQDWKRWNEHWLIKYLAAFLLTIFVWPLVCTRLYYVVFKK
jgi:hypothetical protein